MKFEHRIEINDAKNPSFPVFTREQLWNGLVLRAESPKLFLPNLDLCRITSRNADGLTRSLQFGELTVHDHVHFDFLNFVHYQVPQQGDIPNSNMRMTIEELAPSVLFVRFNYESEYSDAEDKANAMYNEYRCSAYLESDNETIQILREMHRMGRLA
jgi:hypothetical protein